MIAIGLVAFLVGLMLGSAATFVYCGRQLKRITKDLRGEP